MSNNTSPRPSRLTDMDLAMGAASLMRDRARYVQSERRWYMRSEKSRPGFWSPEYGSGVKESVEWSIVQTSGWPPTTTAVVDRVERSLRGKLYARRSDFDADPWLLGVKNGVVDLRTKSLRDVQPDDLLTKRAGVSYDPKAECPNWLAHVRRVANDDPEVVDLIHLAVGMSLVGYDRRKSHGFFAMWGEGGNGKGTFARALRSVLGDYAHELPARELTASGDKHSTSIADLDGCRFVTVSEVSRGNLDADKVMYLTGGDDITARGMRQDNKTFHPSHALWMFTNKLPRLPGETGAAAKRRYRPIETAGPLTDTERDETWEDKLQCEAEGILAWAIEGTARWQEAKFKLPTPTRSTQLRDEHLDEQDPLQEWADSCLVKDPAAFTANDDLLRSLSIWRKARGMKGDLTPTDVQDLYDWFRRKGVATDRRKVGGRPQRGRKGVKIRGGWAGTTPPPPLPDPGSR